MSGDVDNLRGGWEAAGVGLHEAGEVFRRLFTDLGPVLVNAGHAQFDFVGIQGITSEGNVLRELETGICEPAGIEVRADEEGVAVVGFHVADDVGLINLLFHQRRQQAFAFAGPGGGQEGGQVCAADPVVDIVILHKADPLKSGIQNPAAKECRVSEVIGRDEGQGHALECLANLDNRIVLPVDFQAGGGVEGRENHHPFRSGEPESFAEPCVLIRGHSGLKILDQIPEAFGPRTGSEVEEPQGFRRGLGEGLVPGVQESHLHHVALGGMEPELAHERRHRRLRTVAHFLHFGQHPGLGLCGDFRDIADDI